MILDRQMVATRDQIRRDNDTVQEINIGLADHDMVIKWYFENVIKPTTKKFGEARVVPIVHRSNQKWKASRKDGYMRDKEGKLQIPIIVFSRTSTAIDRSISSKVDGYSPQVY